MTGTDEYNTVGGRSAMVAEKVGISLKNNYSNDNVKSGVIQKGVNRKRKE